MARKTQTVDVWIVGADLEDAVESSSFFHYWEDARDFIRDYGAEDEHGNPLKVFKLPITLQLAKSVEVR